MTMEKDFSDLSGKILIAAPYAMEDNVFHQSMIFMVDHTSSGAAGFIFNRPLKNMPNDSLFTKINEELAIPDVNLELHVGGPMNLQRGFFLHTTDYNKNLLYQSKDDMIGLSSNTEIIDDIAKDSGPEKIIFIVGYTCWEPGQLEFEIENHLWIVSELNLNIIFNDIPNADNVTNIKWKMALSQLGINTAEFIPSLGKC